jgi:hypothetical protein
LNAKKFNDHSFLSFFCLRKPSIFALNVHFFQALYSFHDGFIHIRPRGNNCCMSMVQIRFDVLLSSIWHHNHLSIHSLFTLPFVLRHVPTHQYG